MQLGKDFPLWLSFYSFVKSSDGVLPVQLAAERLSRLSGVDCDSFRICSYVVEDEHGLLGKKAEASPNAD